MDIRYIVHGVDRATGASIIKVIEAPTAAEAERIATNLNVLVAGVEVDPSSLSAPLAHVELATDPKPSNDERELDEVVLWQGTPSQWENLGVFILAVLFFWLLLIPVLFAIRDYLWASTTRYMLTTQRIRVESGILSKRVEEIELYRIKDHLVTESFIQRNLGYGTVHVLSSDRTKGRLRLRCIGQPRAVGELLREHVAAARRRHRVREIDMG